MKRPRVRAVATTQFGCQERTDWYPEGSPEAIEARDALVRRQTGEFSISWEEWPVDLPLPNCLNQRAPVELRAV